MRRSRVLAATAVMAVAALVLGACGSSPGQADDNAAPTNSADQSADDGDGTAESPTGDDTGEPAGAVGEVGGSACGAPHGAYESADAASGSINVGFNEMPYSLNPNTGHGNSVYNNDPVYLMNAPGLFYYDKDSELINNDGFGTCVIDSLDPLTITYTIGADVTWSDGVPVTVDDLILEWIAESGHWNTAEVEYDEDDNPVAGSGIAFDADSPGARMITEWPKVADDGKSMTVAYSEFFVDYQLNINVGVPAHVVATHALDMDDPAAATKQMMSTFEQTLGDVDAASDDQKSEMAAVANFWNTGFDMTSMPDDASLVVGAGSYVLTDWKKDQYMTFEVNPDYAWGPKPGFEKIVWTYAPDPTASVQSLQNGDLDMINGQPTADILDSLNGMADQGIGVITNDGATYEHVDLVFTNGGPFDPASYGGDADVALKVRQAFLLAVPRQQIVDSLIKPLNPDVQRRDSFMFFPGQPGYDEAIAANGSDFYADAGSDAALDQAKSLLQEAGVSTPIDVRFLYADNNPRRAQEYALIADSAAKIGFNVLDEKDAGWGGRLSNPDTYDASLFAWASESTAVSESVANFLGEDDAGTKWGQNNFGQYYSPEVNDALNALLRATDPDQVIQDQITADTQLWADAFGTVLFQHPDLVGYNENAFSGASNMPLNPTYIWNFWEWRPVG